MRYQFTVDFDCDEDAYREHVANTLEGFLAILPYMLDNVDINYYVFSEDEEDATSE